MIYHICSLLHVVHLHLDSFDNCIRFLVAMGIFSSKSMFLLVG